jgi:transposase InsO family protein
MRFAFIQSHAHRWHITTMCRVLEVSRAGYYAWRARPLCGRGQTDQVLTDKIKAIQDKVEYRYGSPRVRVELRTLGFAVGKHRVARLMREAGVLATAPRPRFQATTDSAHGEPIAPNLVARQFDVADHPQLDRTWVGDITYIPTGEDWLYLAVLLDLASRRVVGWALGTRLTQELTLSALRMALLHRGARGVVHHSDRGVQYASRAYQQLLASADCTPSMSRVGDCWDNAVAESFFATLTKELLHHRTFPTRDAASRALVEFIEIWYNRQRRHSTLGYLTPVEYETQLRSN